MPERLTDPRYWKQTTQDIAGAFAAPPKPQGTPGAFIENVQRPTDQFANEIGEQISPTLGAFGMGQLAGDTALRFSEGDYTGAAMNAPMLAMAVMPGKGRLKLFRGESSHNRGGTPEGVFYTPDRDWARQFTQGGLDKEIKQASIPHDSVYDPPSPVYAGHPEAVDAAIAAAREKGMKAVRLSEGQGEPPSVFIFDKSVLSGR
jgi:hypothetical protein